MALVAAALVIPQLLSELPPMHDISEITLEEPLRIYAADGSLMAQFGVERRQPVTFMEVPPLLVSAFLAAEDSRFFAHPGIDMIGLMRAALSYLRTGAPEQGGSTITMQLARNIYLTPEKTIRRKLIEIMIALRLEHTLSKDDILTLYLNRVFFGHRAYGVQAAAQVYYGKSLSELDLAQLAMLAGIVQAPSKNNPVSDPARARARRDYVLRRMHELGSIDDAAFIAASASADPALITPQTIETEADYVSEMARRQVLELFPEQAYTLGLRVHTTIDPGLQANANAAVRNAMRQYDLRHGYSGPERTLSVRGLSDPQLDLLLEEIPHLPDLPPAIVLSVAKRSAELYLGGGVRDTLPLECAAQPARAFRSADTRGATPTSLLGVLAPGDVVRLFDDPVQGRRLAAYPRASAALVALDPRDGAIRALVGGYAFSASKFNRVTDARRQPGSSFKPFLYASALANGHSSVSILDDSPVSIHDSAGGIWEPQNFGGNHMGEVRLQNALVRSLNLATVNLLQTIGIDTARSFIPRFGIGLEAVPPSMTLALGSGSVSPLLMARGYAVFANGGYLVDPYVITRIEAADGRILFGSNPRRVPDAQQQGGAYEPAVSPRVIEADVAFQIHVMLSNVISHGTGKRALALERTDLAGKTGTSSNTRDAWFCGYHPDLVAVTWMGTDDFKPLGSQEVGGRAALGLWMDFMREALRTLPIKTIAAPEGILMVLMNEYTEALTDDSDPDAIPVAVPLAYASMIDTLPAAKLPLNDEALELSTGPYREEDGAYRPPERLIDRLF
jgi:penicillin-binding protein 1A